MASAPERIASSVASGSLPSFLELNPDDGPPRGLERSEMRVLVLFALGTNHLCLRVSAVGACECSAGKRTSSEVRCLHSRK
jgi:hypothetical protein